MAAVAEIHRYSPAFFLGMFSPRDKGSSADRAREEFVQRAKTEPNIFIETASFIACIVHSPSATVITDTTEDITLLLHGEIYNKNLTCEINFPSKLREKGIETVRDLDGSFALLTIDKSMDKISVSTDRVNSRKVFYSQWRGSYWVSTSLNMHPTDEECIDIVGLGYYLSNGVIYNGHTLFEGIRVLDRASIHRLEKDGLHSTQYWSYEFTNGFHGIDERKLSEELADLLINGVSSNVNRESDLFLSLSGGHDSRAILGIMAEHLRLNRVRCFSYALGEPKPGSDPYIARKTARYLGVPCKVIQSYRGDLVRVIKQNKKLGQGQASFCDEIDAWFELSEEFGSSQSNILFVGEHCFGYIDCNLRSYDDIMIVLRIQGFDQFPWLAPMLPGNVYAYMLDAVREDMRKILQRCPPSDDFHDIKDILFLDQRLCNVMLPWRDFIAGQFINVRYPFLSNALLDFMKDVPSHLRRNKILYKTTIEKMFPEIYKIKVANKAGYVPNWRQEFIIHQKAVEDLVRCRESPLDSVIPPELIALLLKQITSWKHSNFSPITFPGKVTLRTLKGTRIGNWMLRRFPVVDLKNFLKRVLTIRLFLGS